jgi:ABC-2 type transport system ATP-binding protein
MAEIDFPKSFAVPGALRTTVNGREALVAVAQVDDSLVESLRNTWNAEVTVENLNLEEIFLELNQTHNLNSPISVA